MTKEGECLDLGVDEASITENSVVAIFEGDSANAVRTVLRLQGNPSDFINIGGPKIFK